MGRAFGYVGLAAVVFLVAAPALAGYVHADNQVAQAAAAGWANDLAVVALASFGVGAALWLARSPGPAIVAVALLELVAVNKLQGMTARVEPYPLTPALAALPDGMPGRVSSEALLAGGANAATVHHRYDVTGDSPFHLAGLESLQENVPEIVWWRLLNVAWVATERTFPPGAPVERMAVDGGPPLYRVLVDAPATWIASVDGETTPLTDPSFDPRASVALSLEDAKVVSATLASTAAAPESSTDAALAGSELESYGSLRASARVRQSRPGLAVLSTAYAPGWRASASGSDGHELGRLPVVAAYGALVATPLPAGEWLVRWTYLPGALILGAAISVLAAVTGGAIWLRTFVPRP